MAALIFSAVLALAQVTKVFKAETYQDLIAKAQNLALQKDRQQAMNILANAIRKENSKTQANNELKKSLNEISIIFFDDRTQQLYEVAITLKRTDLNQALQKITEAQRAEPDNSLLALEQARILIGKSDCSNAEEVAAKQLLQDPYFEELSLARAQAAQCMGKLLPVARSGELPDVKKSIFAKFWLMLEVEKRIKDKNLAKASEVLASVKKLDNKYPEIDYWHWKIDQLVRKKKSILAEKYIMTCKNISAHLYRQYMMDPMLCRRVAEMENSGNE